VIELAQIMYTLIESPPWETPPIYLCLWTTKLQRSVFCDFKTATCTCKTVEECTLAKAAERLKRVSCS